MKIHCYASIVPDADEPIACIGRFVAALRAGAIDTDTAAIDLNLVGTSARARTTLQEFRPERVKSVSFGQALDVVAELTLLSPAKMKSLHYILAAKGFRWKGSPPDSTAGLALIDTKSLQRKRRFLLTAHLHFEASTAAASSVDITLAAIEVATGIRFDREASLIHFSASDPGRATADELLCTALAWRELVETVGRQVRETVSLEGIRHLKTPYEALSGNFAPSPSGKADRIDFGRVARAHFKRHFPQFTPSPEPGDGNLLEKPVGEDLRLTLSIDKRARAYSRKFTARLGLALTTPNFAPSSDRAMHLSVHIFEFFGIGPLPMQWTYSTATELEEALQSCSKLLTQILAQFEPAAFAIREAYRRRVEEFPGPRRWTAREAYTAALLPVRAYADDAALIGLGAMAISEAFPVGFEITIPAPIEEGRLVEHGGWRLIYHSRSKQENLHVEVPCRGDIRILRQHAPHGRQWPSDIDQILDDGWCDSDEALRIARGTIESAMAIPPGIDADRYELSSRADPSARAAGFPLMLRDGMFKMEQAWRISFDHRTDDVRTTALVTVPACGDGKPAIEIRRFDRLGAPLQP
jgi:hypothetical protein